MLLFFSPLILSISLSFFVYNYLDLRNPEKEDRFSKHQ
jgi:hypothetical protein